MGKIMLNGVDYSAPGIYNDEDTGANAELLEKVDALEEKTKNISDGVVVSFSLEKTADKKYGYLDENGEFHEFGEGGGGVDVSALEEKIEALKTKTENIGDGITLSYNDLKTTLNINAPGVSNVKMGIKKTGAVNPPTLIFNNYDGDPGYKLTIGKPSVNNGMEINLPFSFGIDADGNYGYIKDGADTVTPFKSGGLFDISDELIKPVYLTMDMLDEHGITMWIGTTLSQARFELVGEGNGNVVITLARKQVSDLGGWRAYYSDNITGHAMGLYKSIKFLSYPDSTRFFGACGPMFFGLKYKNS